MKPEIVNDHDLLITLNAKVDNLSVDIKQMGDGINAKLIDHETRLKAIEKLHDELNPNQVKTDVESIKQEVHDFKFKYKFIVGSLFIAGAVFSWLLANIRYIKITLP